jgi:putative restriction endonuclease
VVPKGIPLSKIHHAVFDAHLIGIDADYGSMYPSA